MVQAIALICLAHFSRKFGGITVFPPSIKSILSKSSKKEDRTPLADCCSLYHLLMLKNIPYNMVFHKCHLIHS